MTKLNSALQNMEVYASKAISARAKQDPNIMGLSFGEPEFGPPEHLQSVIEEELTYDAYLDSVKRYEASQGSLTLRKAIANWYKTRYGMDVNPETEVMVTHGGVEAITLAILCTSELGHGIAVTDPSYMLYERTVQALGRQLCTVHRDTSDQQYVNLLEGGEAETLAKARTLIINSPENPSGYVLSEKEWAAIAEYSEKNDLWVVHDEVYDTMAFDREHLPFRNDRSILINSFSKKFGIPGMRIGWMVAHPDVIELASKTHDYLYLGVNRQYEKIAARILSDDRNEPWLAKNAAKIQARAHRAQSELGEAQGFQWKRQPLGAMFLFPDVSELAKRLPEKYQTGFENAGDAVAEFLLEEVKVAVVPGSVYGDGSKDCIRLVLCTFDQEFDTAMERLVELENSLAPEVL